MPWDFSDAVNKISTLENRGWRLGLDRMQEFLSRLKIQNSAKFFHVAGTNGKGSVTAFIQYLLMEQGLLTGAAYSPYVYSVRERIQLGDSRSRSCLIPPEDFADIAERMWPIAESLESTEFGGVTEFEFKTAMGFLYWYEKGAEAVALEVGLGGRLDATNVIDPACSVIVSIGLDHTEILGENEAQIAIEKAGIIKPGRPVVVGHVSEEAWSAIETIAKVSNSQIWRLGRDFFLSTGFDGYRVSTPKGSYERLSPGIKGAPQPDNMAIAIAALDAADAISRPNKIAHGVAKAHAPGRMQLSSFHGRKVLLDGAHNVDAVLALIASISQLPESQGRVVLVSGMLDGHSASQFYDPLAKVFDEIHFAPIDFHRSRKTSDLMSEAGWLFQSAYEHESVADALESAASSNPDLILVTGSFYLVGEVGRLIGLA